MRRPLVPLALLGLVVGCSTGKHHTADCDCGGAAPSSHLTPMVVGHPTPLGGAPHPMILTPTVRDMKPADAPLRKGAEEIGPPKGAKE